MTRAEKFIKLTILAEGGDKYTNDATDKGKGTKFGISDARDGKIDGLADLNNDGKGDKRIQDLTCSDATELYKKLYFDPVKADEIHDELLALHVFDFGVTSNCIRAIKYLQKIAGVKVDGVLGSKTLAAVNSSNLTQKYIQERRDYYQIIADYSLQTYEKKIGRKATNKEKFAYTNYKYLKGWLNRVNNLKV